MKTLQINFDLESDPPSKGQIEAEKQRVKKVIKKIKVLNVAAVLFVLFFLLLCIRVFINSGPLGESLLQVGLLIVFAVIALVCGFWVNDSDELVKEYISNGKDVLQDITKDQAQEILSVCDAYPVCMEYATKVSMQNRPLTVKEAERILDWPKKQKRDAERQEEEQRQEAAFNRLRNLG